MHIVDIGPKVVSDEAASTASADSKMPTIASITGVPHNDAVGPGDELAIRIYEVGSSLFGSSGGGGNLQSFDTSAKPEDFPAVVVASNGTISLPYAGSIQVAGLNPVEIQTLIERAYRGKSQSLQAIVAVKDNISESVYVTGDVRKPGRVLLTLQNERLLDAISAGGGANSQSQDMVVRFFRQNQQIEERLDRIYAGAPDDLVLMTGDRIELITEPQTFTVFGAAAKVDQIPFNQRDLTLAEAVARAGGPADGTANPKSVFLFRYDPPAAPGGADVPTIYRLNMMSPQSYFLAQNFHIRNKDVLYISTAAINRLGKFIGILNQVASPIVTAKVLSDQ
jgi:polysaccharide export outer membrane protein